MEKELACWIYWEETNDYYCFHCVEKRLDEINNNKEFSESIDYESGDECGYMQDYANEDYSLNCCKCGKDLYSLADCNPQKDTDVLL